MRLTFTSLFLLSLFPLYVSAQTSCCSLILPNPGFENNVGLPTGGCTFPNVQPWNIPTAAANPCNAPGNPSPDYYHRLGTGTFGNAPNTWQGQVSPHSGDAMFGAISWTSGGRREYLSNEMSCAMIVGETYEVSFWVHSSNNPSGYMYTQVGANLSVGQMFQTSDNAFNITPTFEASTPVQVTGWIRLTFTFVADQPYTHITLGNFRNNANTTAIPGPNGSGTHGYYFYDDVNIRQITNAGTLTIDLGPDVSTCTQDPTMLDAGLVGARYLWSTGDTTQMIPALTGGTYSVTVTTDCGSAVDEVEVVSNRIPIDTSFCTGSSVRIDGTDYNRPGNYLQNTGVVDANGCPEQFDITVTELPRATLRLDTAFCEGDDIELFGTTYDESTSFITVSPDPDANGCPADIFVVVEEEESETILIDTGFCPGGSVTLFNRTYTTTRVDIFPDPSPATSDCSDQIVLNVQQYPVQSFDQDTFFCQGDELTVYGQTFTRPRRRTTYATDQVDANGCTVNVNLRVSERRRPRSRLDTAFCPGSGIVLYGRFIDQPTTFIHEEPSPAPGICGEEVNVTVGLLPFDVLLRDTTVCQGDTIMYFDQQVFEAGEFRIPGPGQNAVGCPNQYDLTVTESIPTTAILDTFVCSGQSIDLFGRTYTTDSSFVEAGLDPGGNPCGLETSVFITEVFRAEETIDTSFCFGTSVSLFGNTYSGTGQEFVDQPPSITAPCGRRVTINLTERPENTATLDTTVCNGQTIDLFGGMRAGGDVFDVQDATPDAFGCGSRITVSVTELPRQTITLDTFICEAGDIELFGTTYAAAQTVTVDAPTNDVNGCGQDLRITISENTAVEIPRDTFYCENESIVLGSQTISSPQTARVQTPSLGPDACPQFFLYNVTERPLRREAFDTIICTGTSVDLFGQTYTGAQTFTYAEPGVAPGECGLEVEVTISEFAPTTRTVDTSFCAGTSIDINGEVYFEAGTYIQPDPTPSVNGCARTLVINLAEDALPTASRDTSFCQGQSIELFGTIYTAPTSFETEITSADPDQCNTILTTNVLETPLGSARLDTSFCEGTSIELFGTTYAAATTFDVEVPNSVAGECNVVLTVDLTQTPYGTAALDTSFCEGTSIELFGTTYDEPTVFDVLQPSGVAGDCDVVLTVDLARIPYGTASLDTTFCEGTSIELFGTTYAAPTSFDVIRPSTVAGECDVVLTVNLAQTPFGTATLDTSYCENQSIDLFGTTYSAPTVFDLRRASATAGACDEILTVNLTETALERRSLDVEFCEGSSVEVFGQSYAAPTSFSTEQPGAPGECNVVFNVTVSEIDLLEFTIDTFVCQGGSIEILGQTYTSATSFVSDEPPLAPDDCPRRFTVNINEVGPTPRVLDTVVCTGGSIMLFGEPFNSAGTFQRALPGGVGECGIAQTINISLVDRIPVPVDTFFCPGTVFSIFGNDFEAAGNYSAVLPPAPGSDCERQLELRLRERPVVTTAVDTSFCRETTIELFGRSFASPGRFNVDDPNPDANGCSALIDLTLNEYPVTTYTVDIDLCPGGSETMFGQTFAEAGVFSAVDNTPDANGCVQQVTVRVNALQPETVIVNESFCPGNTFAFRGELYTEAGEYEMDDVELGANGCLRRLTLDLREREVPMTVRDTFLCPGEVFDFRGTETSERGTYRFVAGNAAPGSCPEVLEMNLEYWPEEIEQLYDTIYVGQSRPFYGQFPTESGRYTTVQEGFGVEGCDLRIILDLEVIPQDIYVPTAFSPNNDGVNDFFFIQTEPNSIVRQIDRLMIYDRWGDEVFSTTAPELNVETMGWDGTLDGKPMNPAVFVYYVAYTMETGEQRTAKGDFVLMR